MSGSEGEGRKEKMDDTALAVSLILLHLSPRTYEAVELNYRVESCVTALLTSSMGNVLTCHRNSAAIEKRLQVVVLRKVSIS